MTAWAYECVRGFYSKIGSSRRYQYYVIRDHNNIIFGAILSEDLIEPTI